VRTETLIISMPGAPARRAQVDRIRAACGMPAVVIDAIDGRALSEDDRSRAFRRALHRPRYPFSPRPGEIGCFLSHRAAWRSIIDRGLDDAVILEDDVELDPAAFASAVDAARRVVPEVGFVRLPLMERTPRRVRSAPGPKVSNPAVLPLGTQAQVVSADAARRLLSATEPFDRPVDVFLQMRWVTGVIGCMIAPSGVFDATSVVGGSTIQGSRPAPLRLLSREIRRPIYRLAIRTASIRHGLLDRLRRGA
jgi:GR25 family glycosyltransferase involved in LPS biosynthesis